MRNKHIKKVTFNPDGNNYELGFNKFIYSDTNKLFRYKPTGELWLVDMERQKELYYNGHASIYTDKRYKEQSSSYYKDHHVFVGRNCSITRMVKRISKMENLFPTGTVITIINRMYRSKEYTKSGKHESFDVKYTTTRPFKGYQENFEINDPVLFALTSDVLVDAFITALRENGWLCTVHKNDYGYEKEEEEGFSILGHGHGMKMGFATTGHGIFGYGRVGQILFDAKDEFDKWSKCYTMSMPQSADEIPAKVEQLKSVLSIRDTYPTA